MSDNSLSWLGQPDGCYRIGRLGKPHGVKGEISFQVDDDVFDRLDSDFVILDVDGLPVPFFLRNTVSRAMIWSLPSSRALIRKRRPAV